MKLSTRSKYGMNAMFELALRHGGGPASIKDISDAQSIPEAYLEQVFIPLKQAGLIVRGAQGGYTLAKSPADISIGAVIRTLEGSLFPVECLEDEGGCCERGSTCAGRIIWEKLYSSITNVIDKLTLQDILMEYDSRNKGDK